MSFALTPETRKFALAVHITSSVGLLGSIAAFLALAIAGLTSQDAQMIRSAYPAMELIARFVIVPLAFASLVTGFVESLGTPWGLFRHYWVAAKLSLTVFATIVLLIKLDLIDYAARLAKETILPSSDLRAAGLQLVVHAIGGFLVLLVPAVLSVYKPRGLTPYGRRKLQEQGKPSRLIPHLDSGGAKAAPPDRLAVITPRRASVLAFVVVVVAVHIVILHIAGGGIGLHQ